MNKETTVENIESELNKVSNTFEPEDNLLVIHEKKSHTQFTSFSTIDDPYFMLGAIEAAKSDILQSIKDLEVSTKNNRVDKSKKESNE